MMKKAVQPTIRKVYGTNNPQQQLQIQQDQHQMNTAKKINSLLSSGAVSVTGPTQPRVIKQQQQHHQSQVHQHKAVSISQHQTIASLKHCYVCDELVAGTNGVPLTDALTTITSTKVPNKIGRVVGDAFMVIISVDDVVCKRCMSLFNHMDRLEHDLERVKTNILNLINKKYGITSDDSSTGGATQQQHAAPTPQKAQQQQQPPAKLQRLNTGQAFAGNRKISNGPEIDDEVTVTRKVSSINRNVDPLDASLTNIFDSPGSDKPQQQQLRQNTTITPVPAQLAKKPGQPTKIYKCMSCDFKTVDLKQFQPHYETCKQQSTGYRCKLCKKLFTNMNALKVHTAEKHSSSAAEFPCSICSVHFQNEPLLRKHMDSNHPDVKTIEASAAANSTIYACSQCPFKTPDKHTHEEHQRKHAVRVKPFKCRLCAQRFETREQASVHAKTHQPDYFKCGKCAMSFPQRELLMKHFETHKTQNQQRPQQQQQQQQQQLLQQQQAAAAAAAQQQDLTTQKLLQETIDEALRDTGDADSKIHFFSCNICSLTFIQENYYNQHMETHKRDVKKGGQTQQTTNSNTVHTTTAASSTAATIQTQSLIRQEVRNSNATILHTTQPGSISDADIESMFEKMHSDKAEGDGNAAGNSGENMVITSQGTISGGISYSISIPQHQHDEAQQMEVDAQQSSNGANNTIGHDMPVLDQTDDQDHLQQQQAGSAAAVSMPSLDDDADSSQPSNADHLPMDLEEMQNAAESGQIKFILNEDGQILQLDNHIITTDADGNQILVQGTDSEQIQQLLQSVGVLQAGEGDGETFQMIQGENNQMIIVQGDNNEAQLIDASMLNEDGHLVIQHQEGDELPEGMHVVGEDGVQVPVSIAYRTAGGGGQEEEQDHGDQQQLNEEEQLQLQQQLELEHQQQLEEEQLEQQQQQQQDEEHQQQQQESQDEIEHEESHADEQEQHEDGEANKESHDEEAADGSQELLEDIEDQISAVVIATTTGHDGADTVNSVAASSSSTSQVATTTTTTSSRANVSSSTGEVFFNLDDLMHQPDDGQEEADGAEQK